MAINLEKGQRIDLRKKSGDSLNEFCVGVNWGAIETKAFFGLSKSSKSVDLDLSCVMIDGNGKLADHIYSPLYKPEILGRFNLTAGKLMSKDGAMKHSGDDLQGDTGGDDGLDNEIITVNLSKISSDVKQIFFFLNNVGQEDFSQIPYAKIRMYEGTPTKVKEVHSEYNVVADAQFKGKKALIMGKLYLKDGEWKFNAIGDAFEDVFLGQTIDRILKSYV